MNTIRTVARAVLKHWLVTLAVLVNLGMAAPAVASNWDDDVCYYGGSVIPCCSSCVFFCYCSIDE